jgi:ankyrin repeat protein
LIENGADIDAFDYYSSTSLMMGNIKKKFISFHVNFLIIGACHKRKLDVANLLLEHGANPNFQNNDGETALFRSKPWEINVDVV